MAVTSQVPLVRYVAGGGTDFAFPFRVPVADHLKVFVAGVQVATGYSLTGVGDPAGGTLTFTVAPTVGTKIVLARQTPIERSTDYVEGGALRASELDDDFDAVTYMVQDIRADAITTTEFQTIADQIEADSAAAVAAVANTSASEIAAAASQVAALASQTAAATSESIASTSASNASTSETNAATSASTATTQATNAATSASTATTQASSATASASTATTQASNASASATAAAGSASSASSSASSATSSASAASAFAASAAISESAAKGVPIGSVITVAMATAPTGYLKANGAAVSRTTYSALFAVIGTTFGVGDGATTFTLPELRGEFIRGWDDGRGVDSGRVFGSYQGDQLKAHTHSSLGNYGIGSGYAQLANQGYSNASTTGSTGGAETRPRNVALLYCIKF